MKKGMLCSVFRSNSDCTNGGVTSRAIDVVLIGKGIPEIFEPNERTPAVFLGERRDGSPCAYPDESPRPMQYMFGGNFVWTSDSRFRAISEAPIPVHDRQEGDSVQPPRFFMGRMDFTHGEQQWSQNVLLSVRGNISADQALDEIASREFADSTLDEASGTYHANGGNLTVSAGTTLYITGREYDSLKRFMPHHEVLSEDLLIARTEEIKAEYLASGCQASDVDEAVRKLMAECGDLFEDDRAAWSFLMEEPHEESEQES